MVKLLDPSKTADSDMAGRGLAQRKRRIDMDRRVNRRTAAITIVSALLLGLLSVVAVGQVFSLGPGPRVARQERVIQQDPDADAQAMAGAASSGGYQLSPPNEAEPAAGVGETSPAGNVPGFTDFREDRGADAPASAPVAYCAAVYQRNEQLYRDCAASAVPSPVEDRPGPREVPADPGINPADFLSGGEGAGVLPSPTPDASEDPGTACRQLAGCDR